MCPQTNDLFTTSSSSKGNKALTNPIGLITADEVKYAGVTAIYRNSKCYIYVDKPYFTMTPYAFADDAAFSWGVAWMSSTSGGITTVYGDLDSDLVSATSDGIRPVINLKSSVIVESGNGTKDSPYVIK